MAAVNLVKWHIWYAFISFLYLILKIAIGIFPWDILAKEAPKGFSRLSCPFCFKGPGCRWSLLTYPALRGSVDVLRSCVSLAMSQNVFCLFSIQHSLLTKYICSTKIRLYIAGSCVGRHFLCVLSVGSFLNGLLFATDETVFFVCAIAVLSESTINVCVMTHSLYQHQFLSEALQWRAQTDPDHILYVLLNAKVDISLTHSHTHVYLKVC